MTLAEALSFMNFVLDKDYNGQVLTGDYYNTLLQSSNLMYYKLKFGLPEEYQPGMPLPRQAVEITKKLTDDLRPFKKTDILTVDGSGVASFPGDYSHGDSVKTSRTVAIDGANQTYWAPVEELTASEVADRLGNYTKMPTAKYPICEHTSSGLIVYPVTINNVTLTYFRLPVKPVFVYTIVNDELVPGASIEWEWPEDCHMDIIRIMLTDMGQNLGKEDLIRYSEMKAQKGV